MSKDSRPSTSDPVEWAQYYWKRRGFEGEPTSFLAMSSLLRYQRLVHLAMEAQLRKFKLNPTDFLLLTSLELSKDQTRLVGALARNLMVHATTATLAVDRLEERGLLARRAHPTDRRAIIVSLTDAGRTLTHEAMTALHEIEFGMAKAEAGDVRDLLATLTSLRVAAGDSGTA